jgi:hypothetical protein
MPPMPVSEIHKRRDHEAVPSGRVHRRADRSIELAVRRGAGWNIRSYR